ncbi:unnamed protein product [Cylindrotheca closterium]|uniref:DUF5710 domain-containing protein n=1 Tax=Cylindrotheca closterium TaxID=2856 RepID=A0AAD2FN11_9STRA|nr:unnamed protein product [Cylindrotheca closterium]
MYFLDCPFEEKDKVKALGAKWNGGQRSWYVPVELYSQIAIFNSWTPKGRIFLQVPYKDKDAAKANGARWDATVKSWYCIKLSPKLKQWASIGAPSKQQPVPASPSIRTPSPAKSKAKTSAQRGNAEQASRIQISDILTVSQLQDECRHRGIKGLSGKSKTWLLDQLGVGTVWLSHPSSSITKTGTPAKAKKSPAGSSSSKTTGKPKAKAALTEKVAKKKAPTPTKRSAPAENPITIASSFDWSQAPRITSKLTIPQLSYELLTRDPSAKGLSSKSKSWFLSKLGENSVWTTSQDFSSQTLTNAPVVTDTLTKGQLMYEIMARMPGTKGLSSKSKDDLLTMVAVGSIWTTGAVTTNAAGKAPPAKRAKKEKTTSTHRVKVPSPTAPSVNAQVQVKTSASPKRTGVKAKPPGANGSIHDPIRLDTSISPDRVASSKATRWPIASSAQALQPISPIVPVTSSSSSTVVQSVARKTAATNKKKATVFPKPDDQSVVSKNMTAAQLLHEIKYRNPNATGLSGKNKGWLVAELGDGTPVLGVKADAEAKALHVYKVSFVSHLLADSSLLRAPRNNGLYVNRTRADIGTCVCDVAHPLVCSKRPYRSSELHDYDICKACFDIESLPEHEREKKIADIEERYQKVELERQREWAKQQHEEEARWRKETERREKQRREAEARWRKEEEERERERDLAHEEDLRRFTANIKKPSKANTDKNRKKKFTIWAKETHPSCDIPENPEFDSSFESLTDANLRVEYLFYYRNPLEEEKDDIYTKEDKLLNKQFRYLMTDNDHGQTYSVSTMPSADFDAVASLQGFHGDRPAWSREQELEAYLQQDSFPAFIRNPPKQNLSQNKKLRYTVWTSDGYDNDRWHSYEGPPDKAFDSSFTSLEHANQRAEFVFYFKNPWGLGLDEMDPAETDGTTKTGFRFLQCCPDDSSRWTVSVIPSSAFPFMNMM